MSLADHNTALQHDRKDHGVADQPDPAPPTDEQLTAALAGRQAAADALTQPTVTKLDRVDAVLSHDASQVARDDRARDTELTDRLAETEEYLAKITKRHAALARRADMLANDDAATPREHELARAARDRVAAARAATADHVQAQRAQLQAHRDRIAARLAPTAQVPALLDQLRDAVQSTSGGGGAAAGPQRSPIGLAAAELLGAIHTETRSRAGGDLAGRVRAWSQPPAAWRLASPAYLLEAAAVAQAWVIQARAILTPQKRWTRPGACPDCGQRTARTVDDSGHTVLRPVLDFDLAAGTVRCLGRNPDGQPCGARWDDEPALHQLAKVLKQQDEDEAAERRDAARAERP